MAGIIAWYSSDQYLDLLYGEEIELLERHEYDPQLAGAALLGMHMSELLDNDAIAILRELVARDDLMSRLALDMAAVRSSQLIAAMSAGIRGAV